MPQQQNRWKNKAPQNVWVVVVVVGSVTRALRQINKFVLPVSYKYLYYKYAYIHTYAHTNIFNVFRRNIKKMKLYI